MNIIKIPSPMRLLCGALLAYWLSGIMHPGFVAIAVLILLFIPVFYPDYADAGRMEADQYAPPPPAQPPMSAPRKGGAKEVKSNLLKEEAKLLNSPKESKKAKH
jgi:hypothetical protein